MARVESPVKDFDGTVVGVRFTKGVAECDSPNALNYFRRQGYTVTEEQKEPEVPEYKLGDDAPAGNASTDDWKAWSIAQGKTAEELAGLGRGEIRALHFPTE